MTAGAHAERRLVTCMFIDLVGSTDLTVRLGAERLKHELDQAFGELSGIVSAHGGTVEKYVGDAIYALFGAPTAHEDDTLRALRAAEAVRDWCTARGSGHGHPFSVRVGVETGEAIVDVEAAATTRQQMSVGPVVNIAARLQQRAEPGDVLVGPTAREAAGSAAELEPIAELDLKGIGPVPAWRLVSVGSPRVASLPFVGREAELALLAHAHQRALKGRSVLAVVSGPPGQGKTRLVKEFLRPHADGAHVIPARCRPADETGVFAPLREILGLATLDELAERVGRLCSDESECERVVAGLAESAGIATNRSLATLTAAERDDEIANAWRRYVALLGAGRLVIVAVDDIHWADASLVRLIDRLTFGGPRLLVIATARPEFAESAGIRPSGDRFFIELEGLEHEDAARLAREAGTTDERVVARAEGNPLFLVELARSLRRGEGLPITLRGALGARLDELTAEDRSLLSLAAVVGERFTAADAAFLAGRDVGAAGRALARLADLHFLDAADGAYRFHHGLVREVAYGRLLTAERMKAHARLARENPSPGDVESLAHHWWEALRPPDAEWIWADDPALPAMRAEAHAALLAAGMRHGEHFALDLAVELLERALALADDDLSRARVERALGSAYGRVLRQDEARAHLKRALELFRTAGEAPLDLHAELVRSAQWVGAFRDPPTYEEVTRMAEEAAAIASGRGDLRTLAAIRGDQAMNIINSDDRIGVERAQALAAPLVDAAVQAAEASGDRDAQRSAYATQSMLLRRYGRFAESAAVLDRVAALLDSADLLERIYYLRARAAIQFQTADLAACDATVRSAMALSDPAGPHIRTHALGDLSELLVARGDWSEVVDVAHRVARLVTDEKATTFCSWAAVALRNGAIAHALRREREEALALLRAVPTTDIVVGLVVGVPRALLGIPSPETDARLAEDRWGWSEWQLAAMRAAILGRPDAAERALDKMGEVVAGSEALTAFAAGVRETAAELRGGPPATYRALEALELRGWAEILSRRAVSGQ